MESGLSFGKISFNVVYFDIYIVVMFCVWEYYYVRLNLKDYIIRVLLEDVIYFE